MMRRIGFRWAALVAVFLVAGCHEEEDVSDAVPGDANAGALAIAVEGKVFAKSPEPADEVGGGDTRPSPKPSPTPEPSPSPSAPDEVTLAIFSDCRTGEACLSYGVYEPDTGRKTFVTATCSLNTVGEGFGGKCFTYDNFDWVKFCDVQILVSDNDTVVKIALPNQNWEMFREAPYAVNGSSDCLSFENPPSPPPLVEE